MCAIRSYLISCKIKQFKFVSIAIIDFDRITCIKYMSSFLDFCECSTRFLTHFFSARNKENRYHRFKIRNYKITCNRILCVATHVHERDICIALASIQK